LVSYAVASPADLFRCSVLWGRDLMRGTVTYAEVLSVVTPRKSLICRGIYHGRISERAVCTRGVNNCIK